MRIALISDLHANEVALRAVLADADRVGCDEIICLGDVATLGPAPNEVIQLLRERTTRRILGNHDDFMLNRDLIHSYTEVPVVVDADGLFGLAPVARSHPTILTPHAGELARLLERSAAWVDDHRLEAATDAAERFDAVVVLKGADTLVVAPDEGPLVVDHGPPALATAGTGDVLTGVVAAFLAKGMEPVHAAAAAATAHGVAAQRCGRGAGLIASDVVEALPLALA